MSRGLSKSPAGLRRLVEAAHPGGDIDQEDVTAADLLGRRRVFSAVPARSRRSGLWWRGLLLGRSREPEAVAQAEPAIA